jgi:PASTA domain
MPERWEREIGKLGTLTAPRSIARRVAEDPHGDGMPPPPRRGQRMVAGVVAFAVFGAAAAFAAGAFRRETPSTIPAAGSSDTSSAASVAANPTSLDASLEARPDGSIPSLTLTYGSTTSTFAATDGAWPGTNLSPQPPQTFDATIHPGAPLTLTTNAQKVEASLLIADQEQRPTGQSVPLDLSSGSAALPEQAGLYQLTMGGGWDNGKVGFSVGLTIGTPPSYWPPPAPTATVPDVVGVTLPQADKDLWSAGFASVSVAAPAGTPKTEIINGVVTAQDPAAGTDTEVTTTIKLTVSTSG